MNPIEILWRKIKHYWLPLSCYTRYANLKDAVLEVLGSFGSKYQISFVNTFANFGLALKEGYGHT